MSLKLITPPVGSALTLTEAKAHLRVTSSTEDTLHQAMIDAAEALAVTATGRQLMTATYDLTLDRFAPVIELPLPPLQSVTSVKYIDTDRS